MVAWLKDISNIGKITNQIPIVGEAFSYPAAVAAGLQHGVGAGFEEFGKGFLSNIPFANTYLDQGLKAAKGGGGGGDPAGATEQFLQGRIPGMSYEQVFGGDPQGARATAQAIFNELKGMPATDAQKFIAALTKAYPGSPLVNDITQAQAGTPTAAPVNPYDTLGKMIQGFSSQALPWLSQQMATSDKGSANLAAQMQSALSGASPAMRQAYSVGIPELQAANLTMDKAAQSSLATQPQWDAMISSLTDATAAYKAAVSAAQAEPYWAATTGTGTQPTGTPGQGALNNIYQQILGAQAAGH